MTTNHDHLREVAERAISPGEEWYDAWQMRQILMHEARVNEPALSGDVAFITELTPQVVIALLDELAALRKENEGFRVDAERYRWLVENVIEVTHQDWDWWNGDSDVIPLSDRIDAARAAIGDSHE